MSPFVRLHYFRVLNNVSACVHQFIDISITFFLLSLYICLLYTITRHVTKQQITQVTETWNFSCVHFRFSAERNILRIKRKLMHSTLLLWSCSFAPPPLSCCCKLFSNIALARRTPLKWSVYIYFSLILVVHYLHVKFTSAIILLLD